MVKAFILGLAVLGLSAQTITSVSTTNTQAVINYNNPGGCSVQVADMNRSITIAASAVTGSSPNYTVTITTTAPHGMTVNNGYVYLENSGVSAWDGWQNLTAVNAATTFSFGSSVTGTATAGGNVGVLVDDINPLLFSAGADLDTRAGSITNGSSHTFVAGLPLAQLGLDLNLDSRALQVQSRHRLKIICGASSATQEFWTQNIPVGNTYNNTIPPTLSPGAYGYPNVKWSVPGQVLIDPTNGLPSYRVTGPSGVEGSTGPTQFGAAPGLNSGWMNPSGPLTTGTATYTGGACSPPGPTCSLFLSAGSFDLLPYTSYAQATAGNGPQSLDWFQVTSLLSMSGTPTGNDAKATFCLGISGVGCASTPIDSPALTNTPTNHLFGTGTPDTSYVAGNIDTWQTPGTPPLISTVEASKHSGIVDYNASTKIVTNHYTPSNQYSGDPFSLYWAAGSTIIIGGTGATCAGGTSYPIASVQSDGILTLSSGPGSNQTSVQYCASNFGVLIWKKTATADTLSVGPTTYRYGASGLIGYAAADSTAPCGPTFTNSNGIVGSLCFITGSELYFISIDGSVRTDLGVALMMYQAPLYANNYTGTGTGDGGYQWDPIHPTIWYSLNAVNPTQSAQYYSLIMASYSGDYSSNPGVILPQCAAASCVTYTALEPSSAYDMRTTIPAFNSDWAASGFRYLFGSALSYHFQGISPDRKAMFLISPGNQNYEAWIAVMTLGTDSPPTPEGTDSHSAALIAVTSTYRIAPLSWCGYHSLATPGAGVAASYNEFTMGDEYTTTLTSTALTTTGAGGPTTCPSNTLSVTGPNCTEITVAGDPTGSGTISGQHLQVGDLMTFSPTQEFMRVVKVTSSTDVWLQRGYLGSTVSAGSGTLSMKCGVANIGGNALGFWDYVNFPIPTSANANGPFVTSDPVMPAGHTYLNGGSPSQPYSITAATYGTFGQPFFTYAAHIIYPGYMPGNFTVTPWYSTYNAPFASVGTAIGGPNQTDTHPGPCFGAFCWSAHPMDGGDNEPTGVGVINPSSTPFVNVSGQLYKIAGATPYDVKHLPTMAFSGRFPLQDVSGAASSIGTTGADSYRSCTTLKAGECYPGSSAGDVYVNTPFVSPADGLHCRFNGIANQQDDYNEICFGNAGSGVSNITQIGVTRQDLFSALGRNMGPMYARYNQEGVYRTFTSNPSGSIGISWVRWLEGLRNDMLITLVPPFPAPDGINRGTFIPVVVKIPAAPSGLGTVTAIVEFGYLENGDVSSCTSRQEACAAESATINEPTPFLYETAETPAGLACTSGCTITIPALSEKALYYRWKYLSGGTPVLSGPLQVTVTP